MNFSYRDYLQNDQVRRRVLAQARAERARALERFVFAPIASLFRGLQKPAPRKSAPFNPACG